MKIDFPYRPFFDEMALHISPRFTRPIARFLLLLFFLLITTGFLWAIIAIFLHSNIDFTKKVLNLTISIAFLEAGIGHLLSQQWYKAIAWLLSSAGLALTPGILYQMHGSSLESSLFLLCSTVAFFGFLYAIASKRKTV
jgi:hypothetical protein